MAMDKLPIWNPVFTGYRDVLGALRVMPALGVYALVIGVGFNLLGSFISLGGANSPILGNIVSFALSALQDFFLVPIMIAVHRFIVLDEVMPRYVLNPGDRIFRLFYAWMLALSALSMLFIVVLSQLRLPTLGALLLVMGAIGVFIFIMSRLTILFPAIAVDAPGASASNAWGDSHGHVFRIFLIFFLASLPLLLGAFFLLFAFGINAEPGASFGIAAILVIGVVQVFFVLMCVAIASRLFQALADRLIHSPPA